jgi:hypothetical protein
MTHEKQHSDGLYYWLTRFWIRKKVGWADSAHADQGALNFDGIYMYLQDGL